MGGSNVESIHQDFFHEGNGLFVESTNPLWVTPFTTFLSGSIKTEEGGFLHAIKHHAEKLVPCLKDPMKQTCVFQMLTFVARKGGAMYLKDNIKLPHCTSSNLQKWKEGIIEEEVEESEDPAWTYKFLIPTSVAIATLVILGNVVQYFRQVTRKRYKVKE